MAIPIYRARRRADLHNSWVEKLILVMRKKEISNDRWKMSWSDRVPGSGCLEWLVGEGMK
jgi:hypothetical protein